MATLYEMTENTKLLYEMLESGEIDEQTFNDTCEAMGTIEKVEGYCQVINQLCAESDMYKAEIDRLTARKKTIDNNIKYLKARLLDYYLAQGEKEIKAGTFKVTTRKSEVVNIDESKLAKRWMIATFKPDKAGIKEAIKKGRRVNGAEIITNQNIQIK